MPGNNQRVHIRYGSTWSKDGVAVREANDVAHLLQDKMFHQNENRRYLVGEPDLALMLRPINQLASSKLR